MTVFTNDSIGILSAIAALFCGFSILGSATLGLVHFRNEHYRAAAFSRLMGLVLLMALFSLQLAHFVYLTMDEPWVFTLPYRTLLFVVAPAFYFYSAPLLMPGASPVDHRLRLAHLAPASLAWLLPDWLALPGAFLLGMTYLAWLVRGVTVLRQQQAGFQREAVLLSLAFAVALGAAILGLLQHWLPGKLFYALYAISIGLAFLLVQSVLLLRPLLAEEVQETVQAAYATSTLNKVDCDDALQRLKTLMSDARIVADPDLSLPGLADRLGLSGHQLSELINTRLGKGFSRYLREQRVAVAKDMLLREPRASVLSIGLNAGFTSQSNFYEAFREIEGMTPGQFRKLGNPQPTRS